MYSTFFLGTLYLEHVRHFSALQTGLAFLPWTMTVGALSLGITARIVARFGPMRVLITGMATVMGGLALMTTTSTTTAFFPTMFFAFFMIGLGIGSAFMPLLTIAMADVPAPDAGLGSGIVNLSQQVGGALGIAVLGTIATTRSKALEAQHHALGSALVGGYHLAFLIGVLSVGAAILTTLAVLRTRPQVADAEPIVAERSEIGHTAESGRRRVAIALSSSGARRPQPDGSATAAAAGRRGPGRDWRSRRPRRPAPDRGRAE
jgi:MFS family permease